MSIDVIATAALIPIGLMAILTAIFSAKTGRGRRAGISLLSILGILVLASAAVRLAIYPLGWIGPRDAEVYFTFLGYASLGAMVGVLLRDTREGPVSVLFRRGPRAR